MKKVTLLGDSIRQLGYGKSVEEALQNDFEVFQPDDNCRFSTYTLRGLFDWAGAMEGTDIVHWNNGLWDVCELFGDGTFLPIDEYVSTMVRIAKILKSRYPVVIFATSTPVRNENKYNQNKLIEAFNAAVVPELEALGVIINDLYTPIAADINKYICDDLIHLSPEGVELAAKQVEAVIRKCAED